MAKSRAPKIDPSFKIICVRTNQQRVDGSNPKNKYVVDVETTWGIWPVVMRQTGKLHLSMLLDRHPARKLILANVTALIADLEASGTIGKPGCPAVHEFNPESPGAREMTKAMAEALREWNGRSPAV